MSDPKELRAFLNEAWHHLSCGVADSQSPARYPTFVTVSPDAKPQARTVALRTANRSEGFVEVHTDIATPKIAQLESNPFAAFHIWAPRNDLQIRLSTSVDILTGLNVDAQWDKVPAASRVSYGTVPNPGSPIPTVYAYEKPADRKRFAVLRCTLLEIDLVHLGARHRRATFASHNDWKGTWVAP